MSIEEKLEELQKDIAYMRVDVLAIREYVVDISDQLQKMQQPKVCKWCEVSDCVYKTDCDMTFSTVSSDIGKTINYCEKCGGKIEIVEPETKI